MSVTAGNISRNLGWNVIILVSGLAVFIFLFFVFVGPRVGGLDSFQNTCTGLPSLHSPSQKPPTQSCCHATCPPPPPSFFLMSCCLDTDAWRGMRSGGRGCRWVVGAYLKIQSTSWKWKNGKEWTICLVAQSPPPNPFRNYFSLIAQIERIKLFIEEPALIFI